MLRAHIGRAPTPMPNTYFAAPPMPVPPARGAGHAACHAYAHACGMVTMARKPQAALDWHDAYARELSAAYSAAYSKALLEALGLN